MEMQTWNGVQWESLLEPFLVENWAMIMLESQLSLQKDAEENVTSKRQLDK